eukprot:scaffold2592_cov395-Prasinococcus_capsulatus_cf.AAC.7
MSSAAKAGLDVPIHLSRASATVSSLGSGRRVFGARRNLADRYRYTITHSSPRRKVSVTVKADQTSEDISDKWSNSFPSYLQGDSDSSPDIDGAIPKGPGQAALDTRIDEASDEDRNYVASKNVWAEIRAEAEKEAQLEPLLSSHLYASILSHGSLERSLGFVLANRLANETLLATQLLEVFDECLSKERIKVAVVHDLLAVRERDPACKDYISCLLHFKIHRIAHELMEEGRTVLALALQSRMSEVLAVDIHPAARIGKGVLLDHGTGVVIGETCVIGDNVSIMQGVTLGGTGKEAGNRHPKVHPGVLIGPQATILGNIDIGRGSMVAAGSLVLKRVCPYTMVAGAPATQVGEVDTVADFPSRIMAQQECYKETLRRQGEKEGTSR